MRGSAEDLQVARLEGKLDSQEKFLRALKEYARGN
jgi:hypothetical protein